ncbi:MAG TPA: NAD(P)-dependent oxidoreductase [Burkholderiales bacterium]|jgi:3-hydroxyisobutyrate dehydrogenase-like beta-hydroxyacid dehydrogenase
MISWLGLGKIGLPMAARLAKAGFAVKGFDIDPSRRALAAEKGIDVTEKLDGAELLFTSMPTEGALVDLARTLKLGGTLLVETSTISPDISKSIEAITGPYLRSPISGSTALAEAGTLTVFASGPRAAFEKAKPALAAFSKAQIWLGEREEARYAKLAVNLMVAVTAGMMGEALALATKGGIGWGAILDVIGESAVGSPLVKYKLDPLKRRDFSPAATNALVKKDLDLIVAAAKAAGVPVPLAEHMHGVYKEMLSSGRAEEDFFSVAARRP